MRSYDYTEGKWTPVKDTLPPTTPKPSFSLISRDYEKYQKAEGAWKRYEAALKRLGFITEHSTSLVSRLGSVTIRSRDHADLPLERSASETYDFLCELSLAGSFIRVWIENLPGLNFFLTDIQAQRELEKDESLGEFLKSEELRDALSSFQSAMHSIWMGELEVTIKPPKSKTGS